MAEEVTRLDAEEALAQVNVLQVGTGNTKRWRAQKLLRNWQRQARRPGAKKKLTPEQWRARLAASGIKLVTVPPDAR